MRITDVFPWNRPDCEDVQQDIFKDTKIMFKELSMSENIVTRSQSGSIKIKLQIANTGSYECNQRFWRNGGKHITDHTTTLCPMKGL